MAVAGGGRGRGRGGEWGNCSIRGATRRRHAVAMRLMVQNPPLGGGVWLGERWPGGQATGRGPVQLARRPRGAVAGVVCGGNCSIRGATRRRHAVAVRLMVQNPPLGGGVWPGGRWPGGQATGRGPVQLARRPGGLWPDALLPAFAAGRGPVIRRWWWARWRLARANGGNCAIRGATRRRHAVAMRLMVQNPRWAAGCGPAGEVAVGCGRVAAGCGRGRPRSE